jgi:hypothetical protein
MQGSYNTDKILISLFPSLTVSPILYISSPLFSVSFMSPWDMDVYFKPWIQFLKNPWRSSWFVLCIALAILGLTWIQSTPAWFVGFMPCSSQEVDPRSCSNLYQTSTPRKVVSSIKEFGGVGDGATSNTEVFRKAIKQLSKYGANGGAQLNVPAGRWLTGSFNLTSNFTLFLEEGACILGSQVCREREKIKERRIFQLKLKI